MEESPSGKHSRGSTRRKDQETPVDDSVDPVKCTGKRCQSCTGGVIADCIAVCCCPCAVLSCFTLAFLKAPYLMGKRWLGLRKKKEKSRKCERDSNRGVDANSENHGLEMESLEIGYVCEEEDKEESERVWMELYQLGHLGFGRVSFTGIQSQGKGN